MSDVLRVLEAQPEPLFALLDAGRDPDVLTTLYSHEAPMRSLYQGAAEADLGPKGPYLVELAKAPELLRALLRRGWGQSWGVYLTSNAGFAEVRKHLRTLLMVRREKDKSELYFRFYDPRVLRIFLPTCSPKQVEQMFGPLSAYWMERKDGSLWRVTTEDIGSQRYA